MVTSASGSSRPSTKSVTLVGRASDGARHQQQHGAACRRDRSRRQRIGNVKPVATLVGGLGQRDGSGDMGIPFEPRHGRRRAGVASPVVAGPGITWLSFARRFVVVDDGASCNGSPQLGLDRVGEGHHDGLVVLCRLVAK